jgi:hypothetical protein
MPGGRPAGHWEFASVLAIVVHGSEGKTVNRGIGVRRYWPSRDYGLREDATGGIREFHSLEGHDRSDTLFQDRKGFRVPQARLARYEAVVDELLCHDSW